MSNLSPSTRALLQAAKSDRPSKESRAAIWGGVTSGLVTHTPLHITPSGSGAAGAGASAGPGAVATAGVTKGALLAGSTTLTMTATMKAAFIGALFGSAISIGVATVMLRAKEPAQSTAQSQILQGSASQPATKTAAAVIELSASNATGGNDVAALPLQLDQKPDQNKIVKNAGSTDNLARSAIGASPSSAGGTKKGQASHRDGARDAIGSTSANASSSTSPTAQDDLLSREVALVSEARHDQLVGDAAGALKAAHAARSLEARQFEPEEMSIEARALRELGRDSEADKIEASRRTMYPGQGR